DHGATPAPLPARLRDRVRNEHRPAELPDGRPPDAPGGPHHLPRDDGRDRLRCIVDPLEQVDQDDGHYGERDDLKDHGPSASPAVPPTGRVPSLPLPPYGRGHRAPHWFFATMSLRTFATSSQ